MKLEQEEWRFILICLVFSFIQEIFQRKLLANREQFMDFGVGLRWRLSFIRIRQIIQIFRSLYLDRGINIIQKQNIAL